MLLGFDLHWWETVMISSLWIAAISAVSVGVATWAVVHIQRQEAEDSREKIANANAIAAKANERTAELQLETEKLRRQVGPRVIERAVFLKYLRGKPTAKEIHIAYLPSAADGNALAGQLETFLRDAGWPVLPRYELPLNSEFSRRPPQMLSDRYSQIIVFSQYVPEPNSAPIEGLLVAIGHTLGGVLGRAEQFVPPGQIHIIIFPKL